MSVVRCESLAQISNVVAQYKNNCFSVDQTFKSCTVNRCANSVSGSKGVAYGVEMVTANEKSLDCMFF